MSNLGFIYSVSSWFECVYIYIYIHTHTYIHIWASLVGQMGKNPPAMQETQI